MCIRDRFYGTPAEETIFAKVWMVREGVFDKLDVCMDWHPGDTTESGTQSSKALVDFRVSFNGSSSHASSDPWNGRSAVDAMELYTTGLNYYREHILPTSRIHYQFEAAGDVVNVVPDYAKIWTRLRGNSVEHVNVLYDRALDIAKAAAFIGGISELFPCDPSPECSPHDTHTLQGGGSGKPPAQQPNLASLAKAASDVVNAGGGVSGSDIKNAVAKQKNLIKPTIERLV